MDKKKLTAIILCGGLGSRLSSITNNEIPKPMIEVAGRPFLEYVLNYLVRQGVTKVTLAVSYKKELIMEHFGNNYKGLNIRYSIEETPLGTGGAIKHAISVSMLDDSDYFLVLNGDSYLSYPLKRMLDMFDDNGADLVIALKNVDDTGRYGRVSFNLDNKIKSFEEKKNGLPGQINAGVYLLSKKTIGLLPELSSFSFEKDFLEEKLPLKSFSAFATLVDSYFIDIGIPEDYLKANQDFQMKQEQGLTSDD
ncbi:nucleotidyltransferase family protein [Tenacibaculum sp.]|uniref:nucleotidyltransferase family protein n=1 Tax=Tenacibaculum sp. TaxID=1906242 RepID=UPI003AA97F1B